MCLYSIIAANENCMYLIQNNILKIKWNVSFTIYNCNSEATVFKANKFYFIIFLFWQNVFFAHFVTF